MSEPDSIRRTWMTTHPRGEHLLTDTIFRFCREHHELPTRRAYAWGKCSHGARPGQLEGGGIYRLADACIRLPPAISFGWVHGARSGSELWKNARQIPLYKDWNRHPLVVCRLRGGGSAKVNVTIEYGPPLSEIEELAQSSTRASSCNARVFTPTDLLRG